MADPLPLMGGFLLQRLQGIEGVTPFFGEVVNASSPSTTADDVSASHNHQAVLNKMVQGHVERGAHEAQTFCHARQTQLSRHIPCLA